MNQEFQHPDINSDMLTKINGIIASNRNKSGASITVLRECQDVIGYLPVEIIDYIGKGLNISSSELFGVASFYSLFSMVPKGKNTIKICLGTACYVKGIKEVLERISNRYKIKEGGTTSDRRFSLEAVRCLGACGLAPVMVVNQDIHGAMTSDRVLNVLDKYN
ncbi:MAG: NAD(P)H-dependent oxidoreductase subunit E [Desulfobacteraceae bacterium]|nr:MAG: NAD(P)H-dependent oxidoreductase subunit E [Desulfobacteraceae bacterium]